MGSEMCIRDSHHRSSLSGITVLHPVIRALEQDPGEGQGTSLFCILGLARVKSLKWAYMYFQSHMEAGFETIHRNINVHEHYSQMTASSQVAGPMYAKHHSGVVAETVWNTKSSCSTGTVNVVNYRQSRKATAGRGLAGYPSLDWVKSDCGK